MKMILNLRPALAELGHSVRWAMLCLLVATGCGEREIQTLRFSEGAVDVEVTFHGEVSDSELFGRKESLLDHVHPLDEKGRRRGKVSNREPGWLRFEYQLDGERREVLVAKQPLLNLVSWNDIARAGAALPDASALTIEGAQFMQSARVKDTRGNEYRIRLPTCGQSTLGDLTEWNLLMGAVHRGDRDFSGHHYGWIKNPYGDEDLKVGYHGSLTWCQEARQDERVARGYFFVSRFNAAGPNLRTDRLQWRPVLERVKTAPATQPVNGVVNSTIRWSPSRRVGYGGTVSSAELFGPDVGISQQLSVEGEHYLEKGQPDWLRFFYNGKTLLVAAKPIKFALPWEAIARAGAALGDGSSVRVGWSTFRQDAEVKDLAGNRYRVRLLKCGSSTLDQQSEWNALLGGVHRGDGDFIAYPKGIYGWLMPPLDDDTLHIGVGAGAATWCQERIQINGKAHGVNRGYLTIARFHATETDFDGGGFGWRPVLEAMH
jgi:hypothetical protein